ncbi:T9SS type A sorting domain-containing protein, partial [Candidatus Calescamantes bacterium]|nr:T9SS type A sorting domain-containing protein [Candidatus Calescamantes bacterium]
VLAVPKASLFDNFDEVRIFPNPAIASVDIDRIIVDKLQDDITEVNIYNIAGEKVATMDEGVDFYDQTTISGMTLPGDYNTAVDKTGAVVSWMLTNDDGNAVASGVYFIVMTTEGGDTIYKKVALVK